MEKNAAPEPRILLEKEVFKSKLKGQKGTEDNLLIYGDNLLGLKALEQKYTGKIKCIYIDPPYNTKSCFTHYDDSMEHSMWLDMMKERLIILQRLLTVDGSIWISIDDCEAHYLKVLCDEIFGRKNFIANVVWNHSVQVKGYKDIFSLSHNYILAYRKSHFFQLNSAPRSDKDNEQYQNPDNDPNGRWCKGPVANSLFRRNLIYPLRAPNGNLIQSPEKGWRWKKETMNEKLATGEIEFNKDQTGIFRKIYLKDQQGKSPSTLWMPEEVGTTREATSELKNLIPHDVFPTPKPERLLQRILHLSTNPEDLVLDCFAGSGTTGAVAQKMGRRWIMIEMGEHAKTHIIPRLKKVIDGTDQGGISEDMNWKGGGSFRICEIAP